MRTMTLMAALAALSAGTMLSLSAIASDLGYTYGEVRYLDIDSGNNQGAQGGTAIGWYRVHEHAFLIGQLVMTEAAGGAEAITGAMGGGLILPLDERWDAVAIGTFRATSVDGVARDFSKSGYGAQLGLRGMPVDKFEARAFVNYVDVVDDDTSLFVSGDYFFSPVLAAGVAAEFGGNADTFSLGVRYSFGL